MLEALRRRTGQFGLDVVMINVWEHHEAATEARQFCQVHGLSGTVLLDETAEYLGRLKVRGVPFNFLIDESGVVRAAGITHPSDIETALAACSGH